VGELGLGGFCEFCGFCCSGLDVRAGRCNVTGMSNPTIPVEHTDPVNARILAVSEDLVSGFQREPFQLIAEKSGVPLETVLERIRAMVEAGVIRRVRQTLLATKLAHGALVAWKVPEEKLNDAFDFMAKEDPFSGHVVIRSTDADISGSGYRLWTTLKVPVGESLHRIYSDACQWCVCPRRRSRPPQGAGARR